MKSIIITFFLLFTANASFAQKEVVIGEEEVVGTPPAVYDNPPFCDRAAVKYTWQKSGPFRLDPSGSVLFLPTTIGFQTDSLTLEVSYKDELHCPPYAFAGKRYSGIGISDSILRIRPKVLTVILSPDTVLRVYRGSFEQEFDNNTGASAIFSNWHLDNIDQSLYDIIAEVDSQQITQLSSVQFQRHQRVKFTLTVRLGPFWSDTTFYSHLITSVDSDEDSVYSNTINLVFPKLSKSTFIHASLDQVNLTIPAGTQQQVHCTVFSHPTISSVNSSSSYPFKIDNFTSNGNIHDFDISCGPAAHGYFWTNLPIRWQWNDFSGASRIDSITIPVIVTVTNLLTLPSNYNQGGTLSAFRDIKGRMVNQPGLRNIRVYSTPPLIVTSLSHDPDSVRFVLHAQPNHAEYYQGGYWVHYDVLDSYGVLHPDSSFGKFVIDLDFNEWIKTSWPDTLSIQFISAGVGNEIFVVSENAIYSSTNAGTTWNLIRQFTSKVTSFTVNTAGDIAVVLDSYSLEILNSSSGWVKEFEGLNISADRYTQNTNAQPNRVFLYGDDFMLRAKWPGGYPSKYGNFIVKNVGGVYVCKDVNDCQRRLRILTSESGFVFTFSCDEDDKIVGACPMWTPTPSNDDFPIETVWGSVFTGDSTGIWRTDQSPFHKYGSSRVVGISRRKNRLAIACTDNTVMLWTNCVYFHRCVLGLENLDISSVAQGDTIVYVGTQNQGIYRTHIAGDVLGVAASNIVKEQIVIVKPNPSNQYVSLHLPNQQQNGKVQIIDNLGKIKLEKNIIDEKKIDVSGLSQGMYFLLYHTPNKIYRGSFVVYH